jgi:putative transposase
LHAAVNRLGRLLRLTLTPGQRNDSTQAAMLLEEFRPDEVRRVVADASYDSDAIRARTKELKAEACIKAIRARRVKKPYDKRHYKHRNVIERFFGRIKNFRRVATRYDKKPLNFAGFVWLAAWFYG